MSFFDGATAGATHLSIDAKSAESQTDPLQDCSPAR